MSDKEVKKSKKGRKPGKYYVANDALISEIQKFNKTGEFSNELAHFLMKIVEGVAHMPNFINYFKEDNPWGSEMKSDAIYRVTKAVFDKVCIVYDEDQLGQIVRDGEGEVVYLTEHVDIIENDVPVLDSDGVPMTKEVFTLDSDGNQIPKVIEQTKPFNYFTTIAYRAFQNRIKVEKKSKAATDAYKDKVYEDFEIEYGILHTNTNQENEGEYDNGEQDSSSW